MIICRKNPLPQGGERGNSLFRSDDYILIAEDEEADAFILKTAFRKTGMLCRVEITRDGQDAVDYLTKAFTASAFASLPALIVLDLKMPRMNGFDVLTWLAAHREFKNIPAVVLSSSSNELDIQKARQLGAREYFIKPYALAELMRIVQELQARWLTAEKRPVAKVPRHCSQDTLPGR